MEQNAVLSTKLMSVSFIAKVRGSKPPDVVVTKTTTLPSHLDINLSELSAKKVSRVFYIFALGVFLLIQLKFVDISLSIISIIDVDIVCKITAFLKSGNR